MSKASDLFDEFFSAVELLESEGDVLSVSKTSIDAPTEFPCIYVLLGPDDRKDLTKQLWQHDLIIYVDIFVEANSKSAVDSITLTLREKVETKINASTFADAFKVQFENQNDPQYNESATECRSRTRLSWLIEYHTAR